MKFTSCRAPMVLAFAVALACATTWEMPAAADPQPASGDKSGALPSGALLRVGKYGAGAGFYGVYDVVFSVDGKYLATRTSDQVVHIWDARTGRRLCDIDGHEGRVLGLAFSPDGSTLVTASPAEDDRIAFWDVTTGDLAREIKGGASVVRFLAGGQKLLAVGEREQHIYDVDNGQRISGGRWAYQATEKCLDVLPDAKLVAIYNHLHGRQGRHWISLRDLGSGEQKVLRGLSAAPVAGRFSPAGKWLLACCRRQNNVHLWRLEAPEQPKLLTGHHGPVQAVAFSYDGRLAATASWDKSVRVWELISGRSIVTLRGHQEHACAVAFSTDGLRLASGASGRSDNSAVVWNLRRALFGDPLAGEPDATELEQLWERLAAVEPKEAFRAMGTLIGSPAGAISLFRRQIGVAAGNTDVQRVEQLIRQLDDNQFAVREAAHRQLLKLRAVADALLRRVLQETDSAEVRYRITRILAKPMEKADVSDANVRRMHRVIYALEMIGSDAAVEPLSRLATGHPHVEIMQSAAAALQRSKQAKD